MSGLPEFLDACIAEDGVHAPCVHLNTCAAVTYDYGGIALGPCNCGVPARVLADCAAKREIVAEHWALVGGEKCGTCLRDDCLDDIPQPYPCRTLRLLVAVYADRPGFNPAWR